MRTLFLAGGIVEIVEMSSLLSLLYVEERKDWRLSLNLVRAIYFVFNQRTTVYENNQQILLVNPNITVDEKLFLPFPW